MKVSERKVNRPRLTLRKPVSSRVLPPLYRGVVPMLLLHGVEVTSNVSPEEMMADVATLLSAESYKELSKSQLSEFRSYLKAQGIQDYTRESNEPSKRKAVTRNAGSNKAERKQRVGKSVVPVRSVDSQQRKR